jgi:hypothetical protein
VGDGVVDFDDYMWEDEEEARYQPYVSSEEGWSWIPPQYKVMPPYMIVLVAVILLLVLCIAF